MVIIDYELWIMDVGFQVQGAGDWVLGGRGKTQGAEKL